MVHIKTKEGASLWIALLATAIVAVGMVIQHIEWWITLCTSVGVFVVVALAALFIIRKYVAYKLKPIYSIVLSRDVHTNEIFSELKDKRVENIGEELTAWADTNDREIARLKEAECFRKQYLGNVAHELKTPIFNIQGYISTLLDGGLADQVYNGAGGNLIEAAVNGNGAGVAPWAFLVKILFTALTLGAGFRGGEIVPTFACGATFGCTAAPLLGLSPSFGGAVGVAAVFCGVTNCPLSSILLAYELFGGRGLPLFALAIAVSYRLSGYTGLYSEQQIVYSKIVPRQINKKAE